MEHHQQAHSPEAHGCCGHCGGQCPCHTQQTIEVTEGEQAFLMDLAQIPFLPLARFVLASTQSHHARSTALAPVHLTNPDESPEDIRKTGEVLLSLEEKGLITLDYDQPLQGCGYEAYHASAAYRHFADAVSEGSRQPGFLFDLAQLELGSIALTALGRQAVEQLSPA